MVERKMSVELGGRTLSIETGKLAKQANGAVAVQYGETIVLVTVVCSEEERKNIDFLPLKTFGEKGADGAINKP